MTDDRPTDDKPSIAELRQFSDAGVDEPITDAAPVLLEIAAAALALSHELIYLQGPSSDRLRDALAKVRP